MHNATCQTFFAAIIDEHNFMDELLGRHIDDVVDGSHKGGPPFVVKHQDNTAGGQLLRVVVVFASGENNMYWISYLVSNLVLKKINR